MDSSLSSLKSELTQLQELHRTGKLSDAAFEESRLALERRIVAAVLKDVASVPGPTATTAPTAAVPPAQADSNMNLWLVLVAVVLAIAAAAYAWKGSPRALALPPTTAAPVEPAAATAQAPEGAPHDTGADQIAAMVDRLALKLKDKPQDVEGWAMLARSYAVLGRHAEAVTAFERALALRPNDPMLMAGYTDSMAKQGAGAAVGALPGASNANAPAAKADASKATVSGTVSLAPTMAKLAGPEDTVFIFARAAQGERVPLAVLRKQVRDLPLHFTLDDSMGMSPQNKLSGATQVVVSARISKSGQAMPQSGDISGQAPPVAVGTSGMAIEIRDLVK